MFEKTAYGPWMYCCPGCYQEIQNLCQYCGAEGIWVRQAFLYRFVPRKKGWFAWIFARLTVVKTWYEYN